MNGTAKTIAIGVLLFLGLLGIQYYMNMSDSKGIASLQGQGTHYKRINLVVADLDRSLGIYRDILGFTVHKIAESKKDSYSYPVFRFPKEANLKFCSLDSPDQVRTIGLTEVKGVELPEPTTLKTSASVIRVKNLPDVMNKVIELGLEHTEPKIAEDVNGEFTFTEQAFVDPDGHLIVIYEIKIDED